jgi:hypothetical protein
MPEYAASGLNVVVTNDPLLRGLCEGLVSVFRTHGARVNVDLAGIKAELGAEFFSRLRALNG